MAVTLRYFTEFGKRVPTHNRVDLWRNVCTNLLYFVLSVRCRRKESSRSLAHLLMSFLYWFGAFDVTCREMNWVVGVMFFLHPTFWLAHTLNIIATTTLSKLFGNLMESFLCWSPNVIISHHGMVGQFGWNDARHWTTTKQWISDGWIAGQSSGGVGISTNRNILIGLTNWLIMESTRRVRYLSKS